MWVISDALNWQTAVIGSDCAVLDILSGASEIRRTFSSVAHIKDVYYRRPTAAPATLSAERRHRPQLYERR